MRLRHYSIQQIERIPADETRSQVVSAWSSEAYGKLWYTYEHGRNGVQSFHRTPEGRMPDVRNQKSNVQKVEAAGR